MKVIAKKVEIYKAYIYIHFDFPIIVMCLCKPAGCDLSSCLWVFFLRINRNYSMYR